MYNIIPYLRRQKGLKQNDVAEALKISPSYLCKVENGVQSPAKSFMKACSEFFGLPEEQIFYEKKKLSAIGTNYIDSRNQLWITRKTKGIKQNELAKKLNCSPSYLSKIEKGIQSPSSDFKKKCAKILKKKEAELFPVNLD